MNTKENNTGDRNTGDRNTGDRNTGDLNTGDLNTGNWNTGDWNTGNWNTGNWNTGNWNTGNWNTGNWNTGDWNTGNWNTGFFNINEPKVRIFGKETGIKREDIKFPGFLYFSLTDWISESDMTDEQKEQDENKHYKTTGGILVSYDYKEAFQKSYRELSEEERKIQTEQLKALPNFDKDIFFEISGIDIEEEESIKEYTMEELQKKLGENFKIIK